MVSDAAEVRFPLIQTIYTFRTTDEIANRWALGCAKVYRRAKSDVWLISEISIF